jgi:hypothetical protein
MIVWKILPSVERNILAYRVFVWDLLIGSKIFTLLDLSRWWIAPSNVSNIVANTSASNVLAFRRWWFAVFFAQSIFCW